MPPSPRSSLRIVIIPCLGETTRSEGFTVLMLNVNCSSSSGMISPRTVMLKLAMSDPLGIVSSASVTLTKSESSERTTFKTDMHKL